MGKTNLGGKVRIEIIVNDFRAEEFYPLIRPYWLVVHYGHWIRPAEYILVQQVSAYIGEAILSL